MLSIALAAAIADFRVNEIVPQVGGDPGLRLIELFVPADAFANCLFPTTRIEIFDAAGVLLGTAAPWTTTVCYDGGTYFILATDAAAAFFGVPRDARLDVEIPPFAGQVCLASSATRYDCARWGPVTEPLVYLRNTDDTTTGPSIPDGQALARVTDFAVVAVDFVVQEPTPRQPNDGTIWMGPDAGPPPPDAAPPVDAGVPDARVFMLPDARPGDRPDGPVVDPAFLSADPGGGVVCTCSVGRGRAPGPWWALVAAALLLARRRRA